MTSALIAKYWDLATPSSSSTLELQCKQALVGVQINKELSDLMAKPLRSHQQVMELS